MENSKTSLVDRINASANVLVTVSTNPSVDQLTAAIGLTLILNKLEKHATVVFSGNIPAAIEFLQPEKTIEKNTDSLRDFIIALDKSKADKLRYKVEDKMVKIFITPYHTSVTEKDLEFSQGDLNVDLVIALGVIQRDDMDQAITAHGRILHDAVVASINTKPSGELGSINWVDERASSLSEMITGLSDMVKVGLLDGQIATDLLTGIVSETERFSNSKTTSETMAMSSKLMAAGANQQLVATKMQDKPPETPPSPPSRPPAPLPPPAPKPPKEPTGPEVKTLARDEKKDGEVKIDQTRPGESGQIDIDDQGTLKVVASPSLPVAQQEEKPGEESESSRPLVTSPPTLGGKLTANTESEHLDPSTDPFSQKPSNAPLLSREPKEPEASLPAPMSPLSPAPVSMPSSTAPDSSQQEPESTNDIKLPDSLEEARKAVEQAAAATPAQPDTTPVAPADVTELANPPYKHSLIPQDKGLPADNTASPNSNAAPPPVPPPMMPPAFGQPKADESQDGLIPGVPL